MSQLMELMQQQAALARQIEELKRQGRQEALQQITHLAAEFDLSAHDLSRCAPASRTAMARMPAASPLVAPKYRHPQTGATWAGRGKRPVWLQQELESGKTLADFAI